MVCNVTWKITNNYVNYVNYVNIVILRYDNPPLFKGLFIWKPGETAR